MTRTYLVSLRKPKVSFKAPTYFLGGSNLPFTRQGGFILIKYYGLVIMTFIVSRRIINNFRFINNYIIERIWKIIFTIKYSSPPKVSLKS